MYSRKIQFAAKFWLQTQSGYLMASSGLALSLTPKPDFAMVRDRSGKFLSFSIIRMRAGQPVFSHTLYHEAIG
jgi:hypothetical protein